MENYCPKPFSFYKVSLGVLLIILLILVYPQTAIARPARITAITGRVKIKRLGWSEYKPVTLGAKLNNGDQIFPDTEARVRVLCADLQERLVNAGVPSGLKSICPIWQAVRAKNPPPLGTLGGINSGLPYLITPRHSLILTTNPLLAWNRVIDVEKYTIKISNAQGIIWQTLTSDNQIIYPGSPPLSPGISYSVVVETDKDQFSSLEPSSPLQFILLHPEDIKAIEMEVEKIKSLGLPLGVEALTLAEFYAAYSLPLPRLKNYDLSPQVASTYHLSATAIALLETAISRESSSPILERTLGDIYWQIGLAELALKHYQRAIALATSPETLEEKTLAQFALGEVYAALGDKTQAQNWYAQARVGYLSLGHQERADFIGELIKTLQ